MYSRGVVLAHEVSVRGRIHFASRYRTAQLCCRLPQDLGRMPPVLGYGGVINLFFICEFAQVSIRSRTRFRKEEAGATWFGRTK